MDFDISTELSTHSIEFTPINFRTDHKREVANAAMNEANDNRDEQPLSGIEAENEENVGHVTISATAQAQSGANKYLPEHQRLASVDDQERSP
jgi:hypothetical protein